MGHCSVFSQLNANLNASDSLHSNINKRRPFFAKIRDSFFLLYIIGSILTNLREISPRTQHNSHIETLPLRAPLKLNSLMLANNLDIITYHHVAVIISHPGFNFGLHFVVELRTKKQTKVKKKLISIH